MAMPRIDLIRKIAIESGVSVHDDELVPDGYGYQWPKIDGLAHCIACKHPLKHFYHQNGTVEHPDNPVRY